LAARIGERAAADAALARLRGAEESMWRNVLLAEDAVAAAERALAQAKGEAADAAFARATDGAEAQPSQGTAVARLALETARDELETARAARDRIPTALQGAIYVAEAAERKRDAALAAVVVEAPALPVLLDEIERLQRDLVERIHVLSYVAGAVGSDTPMGKRANDIKGNVLCPPAYWRCWGDDNSKVVAPWVTAFETLKNDPNAELPK
jgi:hypothetical protein